jgi:hypothetical protein
MADELTTSARDTFDGFRDTPHDADLLFVQMVETGGGGNRRGRPSLSGG